MEQEEHQVSKLGDNNAATASQSSQVTISSSEKPISSSEKPISSSEKPTP